ncbi:hypothetical protein [Sphingomonas rubra]|uniref:Uncharacterized protein n=1 Tax=Sphingomonas rubra TaxID=634430 RepID=A0A1I5QG06_9SPHN|nr:hypothetical protein [Sphingomonas rubra]SFP45254.1 hypothetical protein SAMN04488241_10220 [Sphingomonas rubra]
MTLSAPTPVKTAAELKKFDVTIRRFDPTQGSASGEEFVLPVDSPDEEHAIASTIANAASWSGKVADGQPLPIAFMAVRVARR